MSKSKKSAKNQPQNERSNAQNCESNMSYATDKQKDSVSDCHHDKAQDCHDSHCR